MTLAGVFVSEPGNETPPGLLPSRVAEGICLSFADGINVEVDEPARGGENWNEDGGKGAGVIPIGREGCNGLEEFALLLSGVVVGFLSSAGTGMLRDSATAMVMADALAKRASGSFAMLLRMTSEKAGARFGLIRAGGVGGSWKCCIRITIREAPRNGVTPVVIS